MKKEIVGIIYIGVLPLISEVKVLSNPAIYLSRRAASALLFFLSHD